MAQQIKKKFIQNDAVDSTKIKLLKDQAVRGQKQDGSEVELLKLDGSDKLVHDGQEIAFKSQVDAEASAREQGDEQVQDNLDSEVSRLEGLISSEESSRMSGDQSLQTQIDTEKGRVDAILLASEADKDSFAEIVQLINSVDTENDSAFASYVLSNNAALVQEVSDRQQGDSDLQDSIDAEESRAMGEESRIESKFDGMMSTETSARQAADSQLQSNIDAEASARQAADSAEQSRAMGVESSLQSQITQEVSDRQSAVSAEASARQSADQTLQSNIDAEETRAMGVEAELQSDLDNLDGYAQDIRSDLDQEIVDRQSAVSAEEAARIAGDSALQSSLNSEISARQSADSSLQSQIDSEVSARQSAISSEEAARIAGDASTLQSSKDYTDGKISLVMSNLDTEALDSLVEIVSAFQSADGDLNQTISDLSAAATSALAAEQAARIAADSSLEQSLGELAVEMNNEFTQLGQSISDESNRAQAAELSLQNSITSLEGVVQGNFDLQQSDIDGLRSDVDALTTSLSDETAAREAADQALQNNKVSRSGDSMTGTYTIEGMFKFDNGIDVNDDTFRISQLDDSSLIMTIPNGSEASETTVQSGKIFLNQQGQPAMAGQPNEVTTKAYVDQVASNIEQYIDEEVSYLNESLSQETSDRMSADSALDVRITALEVQTDGPYFEKQKFIIDESSELSSIELSHECMENSLVVCVGRLMVHKDEDYSVSVVGGKSVLTWMGDFASGGVEAIEEGDVIFVTFARSV